MYKVVSSEVIESTRHNPLYTRWSKTMEFPVLTLWILEEENGQTFFEFVRRAGIPQKNHLNGVRI